MAKRTQGPRFLHQLRTSALPPNHLRTSTEKVSRLAKSSDKSTTPACPLQSPAKKVAGKCSDRPTTFSRPLRSPPTKHSNAQTSTNRSTHSRRPALQSSRTPSPPLSPHIMRSPSLSRSPPHMRELLSSSTRHRSTRAHEEIAESSQVAHSPTLEENNSGAPKKQRLLSSSTRHRSTRAPQEIAESSEVAHPPTSEENNTCAPKKQRRGETRGMGIAKKKRSSNPIEIDIPEHLKRAIGENCQSYITEIGCIVRQNAPLQVKYWSEIKRDDVDALVRLVREKFKLSKEPHVDEAIEDHMKRRYTTWRYNMHKKYLQYESVEEAIENIPENVGEDDWYWLIDWWNNEEFLKLSQKNTKNRDKLTITHCAGTKAFSRIRYENKNPETGEEPNRIDMFKLTRFRENKKTWVGDVAENAYGDMTMLKTPKQTNEEPEKAMSDDAIYDTVLTKIVGPPRSGYIRGLGAGPKPKKSKVASNNHSQLQEATRRADEVERRSTQLAEELEAMKASATQQNEELEAMKANAAQQSEELEVVKAKQTKTDTFIRRLLEQLSSRK